MLKLNFNMKIKSKLFHLFFLSFSFLIFIACNNNRPQTNDERDLKKTGIKLIEKHELDVPEPSGLSLSIDGKYLWTVSDENKSVYKISLIGDIIKKFSVDEIDLEGITVIDTNRIAVIAELKRRIIISDTLGNEISRVQLDLKGENNSGIEGITYDKNRDQFYVVNEKALTLLIKLDNEFNIINKRKLKIADDLSGLSYDESTDNLWIISDESKLIIICNTEGEVKKKFKINIPQIEGIAVDNKKGLIYIVSDYTETLYIFKFLLN